MNGSFIRLVRKSFSLWMVAERLSHLFPVGNGNEQAHYREYNHQCLIRIHMIPPLSQNTETEEGTLLKPISRILFEKLSFTVLRCKNINSLCLESQTGRTPEAHLMPVSIYLYAFSRVFGQLLIWTELMISQF